MITDKNGTPITSNDYVQHDARGVYQIFSICSATNIIAYAVPAQRMYSIRAQDVIRLNLDADLTLALLKQA